MTFMLVLLLLQCFYTSAIDAISWRSLTLKNKCNDTVWFDVTSGAAPYSMGFSSCHGNSDCIEGSTCNIANNICYWTVPAPSNGNFRVEPGSSNTISFPILENDVVWSGNLRACVNGTCSQSEEECDESGCRVNATSPVTLVWNVFLSDDKFN